MKVIAAFYPKRFCGTAFVDRSPFHESVDHFDKDITAEAIVTVPHASPRTWGNWGCVHLGGVYFFSGESMPVSAAYGRRHSWRAPEAIHPK